MSMNSLYEISGDYLEAFENMEIDPETGVVTNFDAIDAISAKFDDKAENVALYVKNQAAMITAIKAEEEALEKRRKALEKRNSGLTTYVTNCMNAVGKDKLETVRCKISFRKSTAVNVFDKAVLPVEYIRTVTVVTESPDLALIKCAIKAGTHVEGAELVEHRNLQIK